MAIAFVLGLLVLSVVVFATERVPVEVFSLLVIAVLAASPILTPREAFTGFAGSAVIMVAGIMLLTGAIVHNGAADLLARRIRDLAGSSRGRAGALLIASVNALSAVINNVAATAVFVPVAEEVAQRFRLHRGRYLIPVAFASMTGGMCTLFGTSTNVAASGSMEQHGLQPLGLFELTPVGLAVALAGGAYLLWVAPRLLPERTAHPHLAEARYRRFLYEIVVSHDAPFAGRSLGDADLGGRLDVEVLAIVRGDERVDSPDGDERIEAGDLLLVRGEAGRLDHIRGTRGLEIRAMPAARRDELDSAGRRVAEMTVSYNSPLIGSTLERAEFRRRHGVSILAIHRGEEYIAEEIGSIRLKAGDVLLAYGTEERFRTLPLEPTALIVEMVVLPRYNPRKAATGAAVLIAAVTAVIAGLADPPTAFLGGAALVLALGTLPSRDAGSYLNLRFLVMLAAMSSLGLAMERSGAASWVADRILDLTGTGSHLLVLAGFFAVTVALTQPLSNAAAALLVLPIALEAADRLGADPRAYAITVAVAASCSFITPFEPACLLVYSTGHYRFRDFMKVGAGLTLVAGLVALCLIPLLWPLG